MKPILLFPGQGAQSVGMGEEFFRQYAVVRRIFDEASAILQRDLAKLVFSGPLSELTKTANLQPALVVVNAACTAVFREHFGAAAAAAAGLSLGELSVLHAGGVIDFPSLVELAALRGQLMEQCAEKRPGGMSAIMGVDRQGMVEVVAEAQAHGVLVSANLNSVWQFVISGELDALAFAEKEFLKRGATRVTRLAVSGAWHSPLMEEAQKKFGEALAARAFANASFPLYPNATAKAETDGLTLRNTLVRQVCAPVLWADTVAALRSEHPGGVFVELGPGRTLQGLVLSIDRSQPVFSINDGKSLALFEKKGAAEKGTVTGIEK